jgi:hypothetical protein
MAQESSKKTSEKVPNNYALCIKGDCPKSANCLRHAAVAMMQAEVQRWQIVSPAYLTQMEGECPMFRSAEKVRYARGFIRMMSAMTVQQAHMVKESLIATFGMAMYYRMRKGTRLITPTEQETIYNLLEQQGVTNRPAFDAYTEDYLW